MLQLIKFDTITIILIAITVTIATLKWLVNIIKPNKIDNAIQVLNPINPNNNNDNEHKLIIMFGWGGCKSNQLKHYANLYTADNNTTLITYTNSLYDYFIAGGIPEKMKIKLINDIKQNCKPNTKIYFHIFSNNGSLAIVSLLKTLYHNNDKLTNNIVGMIIDSAAQIQSNNNLFVSSFYLSVLFLSVRSNGKQSFHIIFTPLITISLIGFQILQLFLSVIPYFNKFTLLNTLGMLYDGFNNYIPTQAKFLFIYSKVDKLVPAERVQQCINILKERGCKDIKTLFFTDSPHVAHFKFHKQEYTDTVQKFVNNS